MFCGELVIHKDSGIVNSSWDKVAFHFKCLKDKLREW